MLQTFVAIASLCITAATVPVGRAAEVDPAKRAEEIKNLKFGMFVCWSLSTFSDKEWTPGVKDVSYFNPTGCDTDQWAKTAKDAGMGCIVFLTKHHDGFCLWDTKTTDRKVTKSPLGKDVLAEVRKSCDKYGLKLALYYSEGDWTWPEAVDGAAGQGGNNPEVKKAQLRELLTQYGPIEFIFFDGAVGHGGLSGPDTNAFVKGIQPGCLSAIEGGQMTDFNNQGPQPIPPKYLAADISQPLLGLFDRWFYTNPERDGTVRPAEEIVKLYQDCVQYGNIFLLDVGPDRTGRLRAIDVATLKNVGEMIRKATAESKP